MAAGTAAHVRALELFVPDLAPALNASPAALQRLPALQRWLSRGRLERDACDSAEQALCQRFGVSAQPDWPVAALSLLGAGIDPGTSYWLCADPVHLQATRGDLVLAAVAGLNLSQADADALVDSLNQHFAGEPLRFLALRSQRWYLRLETPADIVTTPVHAALGRSVDALLPQGAGALAWHRRLNEIQMLLHDHPVNAGREARGAAPVNSVWLWGAGRLPVCKAAPACTVWSNAALARGLARCARAACLDLPVGAEAVLQAGGPGEHLVVLEEKDDASAAATQDGLTHLEHGWFAPLLAAVGRGVLAHATLATQSGRERLRFTATRLGLWKFWRRSAPLALSAAPGASVRA